MADGESDPALESAKQLFFDGLAAFEAGRFEAAERLFVASLEVVPGRPSTLLNLAATRLKLRRPVEAMPRKPVARRTATQAKAVVAELIANGGGDAAAIAAAEQENAGAETGAGGEL